MAQNIRTIIWTSLLKMTLLSVLAIDISLQATICAECDEQPKLIEVKPNHGLALPDPNKIVTCKGRCGVDPAMPCSCHPKCFVYNNCCENIIVDCPHVKAEGYEMYGGLMDAQARCHDYGVFVISSCGKENKIDLKKRDLRESKDLESENNSESKKESREALNNQRRLEYARDFTNTGGLESDFSDKVKVCDEEMPINSRFKRDLADIQNIMYKAPVYDTSTGFVYINSDRFFCNEGNESNLIRWDTQFKMCNIDGITTLEDIEERLQLGALSYRPPAFQNYSQAGDPCHNNAINYCISDDYHLYEQCSSFISYVYADDGVLYKNRFCFQCQRGNDVFYPAYSGKSLGNTIQYDFSILLSISKLNTLRVVLVDTILDKEQWADVNCSFELTPQEEQKNCPVQICDHYFVRRLDGTCKVLHNAMVAFGADEYPLTELEIDQTSKFLSCGLEKYLSVQVEDMNKVKLVEHVQNLNETMYVAKMSIYLPSLEQIATSEESLMSENMTEFFRFLKTFRELRKPRSASICEFVLDRKGLLSGNRTSLADFSSYETITFLKASKMVNNDGIKGEETDHDVTTICMNTSPANVKLENELFCVQEPLYQSELEKILEMCNSPCFSDFMETYSKSGVNIKLFTPFITSFPLFVIATVTVTV